MNDFMKNIILSLTDEAQKRGLKTAEQISEFATKAIHVKYGKNQKINIAEIVTSVFQNIHTGIARLPDDIPEEYLPPDLESPEINAVIVEMATELSKKYKKEHQQPKIDEIYSEVKTALGLTDKTGMILRLPNDEDHTKLSKITTIVGSILNPNKTFDESKTDSFSGLSNEVNQAVNPPE